MWIVGRSRGGRLLAAKRCACSSAVGVLEPECRLEAFPHERLGLRQRVMIAMAVAGDPRCRCGTSRTTALDVTVVQAQVLACCGGCATRSVAASRPAYRTTRVAAQVADRDRGHVRRGRIAEVGDGHGTTEASQPIHRRADAVAAVPDHRPSPVDVSPVWLPNLRRLSSLGCARTPRAACSSRPSCTQGAAGA
jgi:ABC-type microcin C transport system duplicated ATPase subunit YejF